MQLLVSDAALILCVGTTTDLSARVVHSAGRQVLVMVVPDAENAIRILQNAQPTHAKADELAASARIPGERNGNGTSDHAFGETEQNRPAAGSKPVRFGKLRLDPERRRVDWNSRRIELSARQFDLLAALASDGDRVWSYAELTKHVWQRAYVGDIDAVSSAVKRLRRKLGEATSHLVIRSVRGVGYRLALLDPSEDPSTVGGPGLAGQPRSECTENVSAR